MRAVGTLPLLLSALVAAPAVSLPDDPLAPVSLNGTSLSTATAGTLLGGAYLEPEGPHHERLAAHKKRKYRYGTVELVALVRAAAARVAAENPGRRLQVGNLSKKGGGDLNGLSVSHNSGRDADLAFYARDEEGQPALPRRLVPFGPDGTSRRPRGRYRFDIPLNWALVRALLTDTSAAADVQWLFISVPLRQLLLEHAAAQGEDPELIRRAEKVLLQPRGSSPHNDHLHLRVYCTIDDRLDGCRDYGPTWDWVPDRQGPLRARALAVAGVVAGDEPLERRLRAVELLEAIRGTDAGGWLVDATAAGQPLALRMRALAALRAMREPASAPALAPRLVGEADPEVVAATLDTLAVLGDGRVWPYVAARLGDRRIVQAPPEQEPRAPAKKRLRVEGREGGRETLGARAARTLAHLTATEAIPLLIAGLGSDKRTEREQASEALRRLSNAAPEEVRWRRRRLKARHVRAGQAAWRAWWEAHRDAPRDAWLAEGFAATRRGWPEGVPLLSEDAVPALLRLMRSRERYVALNARVVLRRITKLRPWRPGDPLISLRWWKAWWKERLSKRTPTRAIADVGVRAILRHDAPVPIRTRAVRGLPGPVAWARARLEEERPRPRSRRRARRRARRR